MLKTFTNLNFRQKIYFNIGWIGMAMIVLLGAYYWLVMSIADTVDQIQEKRKSLMAHSRILENESLLKAELVRAEKESIFLDNIFPVSDNLIEFPRDISVWANQNSIEVGFSFVKEVSAADAEPGYTTFILAGKGSLANIINFLRLIENSRYLIQYNQYDIIAESSNVYTLLINGQIFSR